MFHYWYRIIRILISRHFQSPVGIDEEICRQFRVRIFDCDGLRVMAAFRYAAYMDIIRWELIGRSKLYQEIILKGLAPTLGSQKIIYRKPLKRGTYFTLKLQTLGWDEKWIYHLHKFEQDGEIKAVGITRALIWKRDKPQILRQILENVGVKDIHKTPPEWVITLFQNDADIIAGKLV